MDVPEASLKLLTLGTHRPQCDSSQYAASPSLGFLAPQVDPQRWKPYAPNLAFEEMTEDDAEWMAGRMSRLSQAQIEAAVAAYLERQGRKCDVTGGSLIYDPQWEFT